MCRALTYEQLYKYQIAGGARYAKSHCDQLPVTPFWVRAERAYDRHPRAFTREHPYVAKLIFKSEHSKGCQGPPPVGVPNPTPPGGPELPPGGIPVLPPDCVPRPPDCVSEPSVLGLLVPTAIVCLLLRRQLRQFINKFEGGPRV
jgi:hypothetical protein